MFTNVCTHRSKVRNRSVNQHRTADDRATYRKTMRAFGRRLAAAKTDNEFAEILRERDEAMRTMK